MADAHLCAGVVVIITNWPTGLNLNVGKKSVKSKIFNKIILVL